jgi:epsilon-lactone hydrolase
MREVVLIPMPIAKLGNFRKDIRQFFEKALQVQSKLGLEYIKTNAPELGAIWSRVVKNNARYFKREATIEELRNVLSNAEMETLAKYHRFILDEIGEIALRHSPLAAKAFIEPVNANGVAAEWQVMPGAERDRVLVYFHGGGYITGSIKSCRSFTIALSQATKMRVLSVDYRLAPEHPFPAALEDGLGAYQWLLDQGLQPDNVIIAGSSAGGHLTLSAILSLRSKGHLLPRGAICFNPATLFDESSHGSSWYSKGETDPILADLGIFWWAPAFLGLDNPADTKNPFVSPLFGDFNGFPPLLVQATPTEMLYDECKALVEKAKEAGVDVTFQVWDGMVHTWQLVGLGVWPEAQEAIDKASEWAQGLFT